MGGSGGMGWPSRTMVMRLMVTGVRGLSSALRSTRAMEATSSTEWASHWPKMVCLPLSSGTAASVMKNWLPLVPGPELAMARRPGWSKVRVGTELVIKEVARVAGAIADAVAALDHEAGDDAVEVGVVVEAGAVHFLLGDGVGPVFSAFSEADEIGYGLGRLCVEELTGEAAHGGVEEDGGAGGDGRGLGVGGGAGGVGEFGWERWRSRCLG